MKMYKQSCFKILAIAEECANEEFEYQVVAEDMETALDMVKSQHDGEDYSAVIITHVTKLVDVYV